eukprot:scaffold19289_cov36-Phaeocystis_antarctica.AAC.1
MVGGAPCSLVITPTRRGDLHVAAWSSSWLPSYHPSQVGFEVFCVGKLLAVPVLLILKPRLGNMLPSYHP